MSVAHSKMLHVEIAMRRLPEGIYLATSRDVPGLTVEADTREEAEKIAPEVALDLIEAELEHKISA
jgi:predicted RNase H-like HicB family nuclease